MERLHADGISVTINTTVTACAAMSKAETGRTDGIPAYACRLTAAYCQALCESQ